MDEQLCRKKSDSCRESGAGHWVHKAVFVVTFKKEKEKKKVREGLNEGLKSLYSAVVKNPGIKARDLTAVLENRPLKTIERQIKNLLVLNLIERRGSRKTGGYWIVGHER